jgi:hypothetical protein
MKGEQQFTRVPCFSPMKMARATLNPDQLPVDAWSRPPGGPPGEVMDGIDTQIY